MISQRDVKKVSSEIVFAAATVAGCPYTTLLDVNGREIFVNVEAYINEDGISSYLVEVSPDGYKFNRRSFKDTPQAVKYLSEKINQASGQAKRWRF